MNEKVDIILQIYFFKKILEPNLICLKVIKNEKFKIVHPLIQLSCTINKFILYS